MTISTTLNRHPLNTPEPHILKYTLLLLFAPVVGTLSGILTGTLNRLKGTLKGTLSPLRNQRSPSNPSQKTHPSEQGTAEIRRGSVTMICGRGLSPAQG